MATTKIAPKDILAGTLSATVLGNTATAGDNTTKLATTAFVTTAVSTKQNTLTTGTSSQYLKGDLSLGTLPTTLPLSSLTAATTDNTIDNGATFQSWAWDSLGVSGNAFQLSSNSSSSPSTIQRILFTGTNSSPNVQTYGMYLANSRTGTTSTNYGIKSTANGATSNWAIWLDAFGGTNNYALITDRGMTGINLTTPTARVHIAGGTAAAKTAPLKLNSGIALTTPEDGAIEYHGSHLYFTIGSTRYQLDQQTGGGGGTWGSITGTLSSQTDLNTELGLKAPVASPTFTGTPLLTTTPTTGDNTHKLADTAFVQQELTASTSYFGPMFGGVGTSVSPIVAIAAYNNQTGTTYSLQNSDNGKVVTLNNASPITLTIPSGLMSGFNCSIVQLGAGQVTIAASGTTINNRQSFTKTAGQFSAATILQYATNTFLTQGDMA